MGAEILTLVSVRSGDAEARLQQFCAVRGQPARADPDSFDFPRSTDRLRRALAPGGCGPGIESSTPWRHLCLPARPAALRDALYRRRLDPHPALRQLGFGIVTARSIFALPYGTC